MATYQVEELSFEVPDDYEDRTVNIFMPSSPRATASSIILTREARTETTLPQQVTALLKDAVGKVPSLRVLGHREREVGTLPGYEVRLHAQNAKIPTYQRQIYLTHYGKMLCLTVTSPRAQSQQCDALVERMASTLRLAKA